MRSYGQAKPRSREVALSVAAMFPRARHQQARELSGYDHAEAKGELLFRQLVLSPAAVANITCVEQIFAMVGILATDMLISVNKPTEQSGAGFFPQRVSTAGNVAIKGVNPTAGSVTPTASEVYSFLLYRR